MTTYTMKAGTYYIGDPCYAVPSERWSDLIDATFDTVQQIKEFVEFDGYQLFYGSTAYGDGGFMGSDGKEYGVDSGSIGVVPIEYTKYPKDELMRLGSIVTFDEDFTCTSQFHGQRGVFKFGNLIIDTLCEEDEDEDYEYVRGYDEDEDEEM